MAQKLTVDNIRIEAGAEGELLVGIDAPEAVQAAQLTVVLPEGLSVVQDGGEYIADPLTGSAGGIMPNRNNLVTANEKDNGIQIVALNTKGAFTAASGLFVSIPIEADASLEGQELECALVDIKAGAIDADNKVVSAGEFSDVRFTIGVGVDPTGINSINAEENDGAAYNLAGQKVGKNYKGIVVKNGKKILVQ